MNHNARAKKISLNGILLALAMMSLFAATVLPTSRLSFYALSSFFVAIIIIEFGIKAGWVFYVASCILSLIVIPDKIGLLPYIVFFGLYGLVKFYVEKLCSIVLEYMIKILYFSGCLFLAIYLIKDFLFKNIEIKFPIWVLVILLEFVFILYDYVYTRFIQYYNEKLRRILKIE